jgi:hypothetical protein
MSWMFTGSQFNQPIGDWNIRRLIHTEYMFSGSSFNQDLHKWKLKRPDLELEKTIRGDLLKEYNKWIEYEKESNK